MLIFIDENGDPGFEIASSSHFVITMVIFEDYDYADKVRQIVSELLKESKVKPEFRFSSCSNKNRDFFFDNVKHLNFTTKSIVIEKKKITSDILKNNPKKFYNYFLKQLIEKNNITRAKIRIDGNKKKAFREAVTYLKREL